MSDLKEFIIPAHPSIYSPTQRELKVTISHPDNIRSSTGILLLIPGYGEQADQDVFIQAREFFSNHCNLITVQCHYFGLEFMQGIQNPYFSINLDILKEVLSEEDFQRVSHGKQVNLRRLLGLGHKYAFNLEGSELLEENLGNFNDMGVMQAVDNISAVLATIAILKDNNYEFDTSKIIIYGNEQGAYLGHLCNAFAPTLFSMLIDNSSWLIAPYLQRDRWISGTYGGISFRVAFDYMAKRANIDKQILDLSYLYSKFINSCNIISIQSSNDRNVSVAEKKHFCNTIPLSMHMEIDEQDVDGKVFLSTASGLTVDYIQLFNYVMENFKTGSRSYNDIILPAHQISTSKYDYRFDFNSGMIVLNRDEK